MIKHFSHKLRTVRELASIVEDARFSGRKVVHCHGVFDLLHLGHLRHFQEAKEYGDILVVTLTPDRFASKAPGRPVFSEQLRAEALANLEIVDYVAINEWPTAVETILTIKPDFYVKGSEYKDADKDITGKIVDEDTAIRKVGGELRFTENITFSSSKLINDQLGVFSDSIRHFLDDFKKRYTSDSLIRDLEDLRNLKVLIIGDAIIDEYFFSKPMGKSAKENIIPAQYLYEERYAGGVLAVANHISGFCDDVTLITTIKKGDEYEQFTRENLRSNVNQKIYHYSDPRGVTTVKRRFVEPNFMTKLFEVCYLSDDPELHHPISEEIIHDLAQDIHSYDLVLVADFGHGIMTDKLVQYVSQHAKFLAVNTQMNSANIGFNVITKYPRVNYTCIDEQEIRMALHDKYSEVETLIKHLKRLLGDSRIVITRGHHGSIGLNDDGETFASAPVFSDKVVDRIGAGDAFLSVTSLLACKGHSTDKLTFIGNLVGALKIRYVCNKFSVEQVDLFKYLKTLLK